MKYLMVVLFVLTMPLLSQAQDKVVLSSAKVSFTFDAKDVKGTLSGFKSSSVINTSNLPSSKLKGSVAVETIKTGNAIRDWSLKRSKYFNATNFPEILFESTTVSIIDSGFLVKGTITIKGIKKAIHINFKKEDKRFIGTATLYSSDFDIQIKKKREENKVGIIIEFSTK